MNKQLEAILNSGMKNGFAIKPNTALSRIDISGVIGTGDSFNEVTENISLVLEKEIKFYRNVLVPSVASIVKDIKIQIDKRKLDLMVKTPDLAVLRTPAFVETLLDYNKIVFPDNIGYLSDNGIRLPLPKNIFDYLSLPGVDENAKLKTYLRSFTKDRLDTIWEKYILNMNKQNVNISTLLNHRVATAETVEDIFIVYIILNSLSTITPDESIGSLDAYRDTVVTYRFLVAKAITERVNHCNTLVNSGVLVSNSRINIVVVGDSLDKFYEKNGEVDAIYGLFVSGKTNLRTIEDIIRLQTELTSEWTKSYNLSLGKIKANSSSIYTAIYFSALGKVIEKDDSKYNPYTKEESYRRFKELLEGLNNIELHDVYNVVEKAFLEIIFAKTNATEFFGYIRYYKQDSDLQTAITYATMEIVAEYICSQIEVVS